MGNQNKNIEKADAEKKILAAEKAEQEKADAEKKALKNNDTYIMKVSTLKWGAGNKKYFYGHQRPVISRKEMGKYHETIDLWLKKGWIIKGSYPTNK